MNQNNFLGRQKLLREKKRIEEYERQMVMVHPVSRLRRSILVTLEIGKYPGKA